MIIESKMDVFAGNFLSYQNDVCTESLIEEQWTSPFEFIDVAVLIWDWSHLLPTFPKGGLISEGPYFQFGPILKK